MTMEFWESNCRAGGGQDFQRAEARVIVIFIGSKAFTFGMDIAVLIAVAALMAIPARACLGGRLSDYKIKALQEGILLP